ncbi:50S ribosomal protein L35 [Patescibacteria group bacterium]
MPKLKTKKTLQKRVRITKTGKIVKKQVRTGHLKEKWDSKKKFRKARKKVQPNKGHIKKFKRMLGR